MVPCENWYQNIIIKNLIKIIGMLFFFFLFQYILQILFDRWMKNILSHYWVFVGLGLIAAYIAKRKGQTPFFGWWILGTIFPIVTILITLNLDDLNDAENNHEKD